MCQSNIDRARVQELLVPIEAPQAAEVAAAHAASGDGAEAAMQEVLILTPVPHTNPSSRSARICIAVWACIGATK